MPRRDRLAVLYPASGMTSPAPPVPDLLSADARIRVDLATLRQALVFAFASSGSEDVFDDITAKASLPASSWDPAAFARDLYLDEVVGSCLSVHIAGRRYRACSRYLARVIGEPPRDVRDAEIRRSILAELQSSPSMRNELERIYIAIVRLRGLLCAPRQPAPRARRVEILRATREAFDSLAGSFDGATSALARLRDFGVAVTASEAHRRLAALLDHDEHRASLDLRVRVGGDGEVRGMQIAGIREERDNPFYESLLRRLVVRFVLFFRGYRTTSEEIAERLLSEVFSGVEDEVALLFQIAGDAEVCLGSLCFRDRAQSAGLDAALPALVAADEPLELEGLYNPLLLGAGAAPIACDLRSAPGSIVVVTGPNSGGKTRLLQAVATAQLLADAGLFVPARAARIPRASGLFASLFEEARAGQPEGHLGMELMRIRRLFDQMDAGGLVVIDELCSGTNPSEGEQIARLVLSLLPELGVRGFVTTHLLQFAERLSAEHGAEHGKAPLEFLQAELDALDRPTYRFVPGVARTSLAHKTAARLGVTREEILDRIAAKKLRRERGTKS
jgi:DNA mismatch repair protein MutS2